MPAPRISWTIIVASSLLPLSSKAQPTYGFKEMYDAQDPSLTASQFTYETSNGNWFQSWGWTLLGYLRVYQSTGDQAYLIKFVRHSKGLQDKREDGSAPLWIDDMLANGTQYLHYNSELTRPMAEYVYMVLNDQELFDLPLPAAAFDQPIGFATHGSYALWLRYRLLETLEHCMYTYWIDNEYCASVNIPTDCERECVGNNCIQLNNTSCTFLGCTCVHPAQLNVQADLAVALYYLAASYGASAVVHLNRAIYISMYFNSKVEVLNGTNTKVWLSSPDASLDTDTDDLEDVAHGASCIQIPLTYHILHIGSLFSLADLEQFAATFSDNIWDSNAGVFRGTVHGTDYISPPSFPLYVPTDLLPTNLFATGEIMCWMPLHEFDATPAPNDIYTVITKQAKLLLENDDAALLPTNFPASQTRIFGGCQPYYGLSEVVKAQWQRECVDITLFNRDLVYDQDFATKHILTVNAGSAPYAGSPPSSFADPIITEPRFTVREGITSQFRAGAAVVWQPGFEAEYGSHVEAVIDPAGCELVVHMGLQGSEAQANEDKRARFPADAFSRDQACLQAAHVPPSPQTTMRLVPNPSAGLSTLELSLHENAELRWDLLNGLGQRVASSSPVLLTAGTHALPMDAASLAPGTYVLGVWVNGKPEQLRWVLTEQ